MIQILTTPQRCTKEIDPYFKNEAFLLLLFRYSLLVCHQSNDLCDHVPWFKQGIFGNTHYLKGKWKYVAKHMQIWAHNLNTSNKELFSSYHNMIQM